MWKILQNIPRGIRNFGIRPVAKCREDEKDAAQKLQHARQLRTSAVCIRLSHHRAILPQFYRSTDHNWEEQAGQHGKSRSDQHRRKSCADEFWSNKCKSSHTIEAVGWGALIVVGLQLSKIYPKGSSWGQGERNPYCPINWLQAAVKLLQEKPSFVTAKKVLSSDFSLEFESLIKQHEERCEQKHNQSTEKQEKVQEFNLLSKSIPVDGLTVYAAGDYIDDEEYVLPKLQFETTEDLNLDCDGQQQEESNSTDKQAQNDANSANKRLGLEQAVKDWDELTHQFTSMVQNQEGIQHAREGRFSEAFKIWDQASAAHYSSKAHFNMAVCYENGKGVKKDLSKACEYYELAALQGHIKAQYNLAVLYLEGKDAVEKDPQRALRLLESAAKLGLKQAQTELGVLYTEEERKDLQKAASLFAMAANQKDVDGMYYLGICHENGWGVPQNQCKAADLYAKAAKSGHAAAQYNLAVFFEKGLGGIAEDMKAAADMYEKAALLGESGAEQEAKRLRKKLHRLEIEEHMRLQFDGGTPRLKHSSSSPILSPSQPTLSQYLQSHITDFAFVDLDLPKIENSHSVDARLAPGFWQDSNNTDTVSEVSSCGSFQITFQVGPDDIDDFDSSGFKEDSWSYENHMDSLAFGQENREYSSLTTQQRSLSMIELQSIGSGSQLQSVIS